MIEQVRQHLLDTPDQTARELALVLVTTRREVNQVLHSRADLFTQCPEHFTWRLREQPVDADTDAPDRPQGPFGPPIHLTPPTQELHRIPPNKSCRNAVKLMRDGDKPISEATWERLKVERVEQLNIDEQDFLYLYGNKNGVAFKLGTNNVELFETIQECVGDWCAYQLQPTATLIQRILDVRHPKSVEDIQGDV